MNDIDAVVDVANHTFSLSNYLVKVPLIHRYDPISIVRLLNTVVVQPGHEMRMPVKLSPQYKPCTSLTEPLHTADRKSILVAKTAVNPERSIAVCQLVNIGDKPVKLHSGIAIVSLPLMF